MDAAADDELRALRARAYGPDADIAEDAVALARLSELEARASSVGPPPMPPLPEAHQESAPSPEPAQAAPDGPVARTEPVDGAPASESGQPVEVDDATDAQRPARRRWLRSRPVAAVVAAVGVLAIVGVTATVTSMQTRNSVYDAPVEAVLTVIPGAEVPAMFGARDGDGTVFADFYGFTPMSASLPVGSGARSECLVVLETAALVTATANSFQGASYYGCGAGPFAPTVSFLVSSSAPEQLRARYPEGTALQFALEPDGVVVLSGAPSDDADATLAPE